MAHEFKSQYAGTMDAKHRVDMIAATMRGDRYTEADAAKIVDMVWHTWKEMEALMFANIESAPDHLRLTMYMSLSGCVIGQMASGAGLALEKLAARAKD
jgi:hypothetical protein